MLDIENAVVNSKQRYELRQHTKDYVRMWRNRTLTYAGVEGALCLMSVPFSKGFTFNHYEIVGRWLVYAIMAISIPLAISLSMLVSSWLQERKLRD